MADYQEVVARRIKRFFRSFGWHPAEWYRWSLAITLTLLVIGVIFVDLNSRQILALLPLAIVGVAIATVDVNERPIGKLFLKLAGTFMSAVLAYSTLRTDAGEDISALIMVLANIVSISGMIFAIITILATSWPAFKSLLKRA